MSDKLEFGNVGAYFGNYIPLDQKFFNTCCLRPKVGLFFHDPMDYPLGKLGGWQHVCSLPVNAAWAWVLAVAGGVKYRSHGIKYSVPMNDEPKYQDIQPQDVLIAWAPTMAIVVEITEQEILAIYRNPSSEPEEPARLSLIRLRP